MANTNDEPEDIELAAYQQLLRIADAIEDIRDTLDAATAPASPGMGRAIDVRVIE